MANIKGAKRFKVAALTFTAALGSGLVMQYGDALASRWGVDAPVSGPGDRATDTGTPHIPVSAGTTVPDMQSMLAGPAPEVTPAALTEVPDDLDAPQLIVPERTTPEDEGERAPLMQAPPAAPEMDILPEEAATDALEADVDEVTALDTIPGMEVGGDATAVEEDACEPTLNATGAPMASVTLELDAPCHVGMPVVIHHQGMMFHQIVDAAGSLNIEVPALAEEAFFIAAFNDGAGAVAITAVPEVSLYDRAVLQWQGETGVQLHAREFGADYGTDGHVWKAATGQIAQTMEGKGGTLVPLGDNRVLRPLMAEVYTFPSGYAGDDGAVALTVEAEVTAMNCGRDISAQSIQIVPGTDMDAVDLTMTMPSCDSVGEFLILNNMFENLTLAAR